jgi:hypothetical protein
MISQQILLIEINFHQLSLLSTDFKPMMHCDRTWFSLRLEELTSPWLISPVLFIILNFGT